MKASRFERKNPICLWTAVSDLPVVDRWLAGIQDRLQPGSDFLGLRNGVGLTRETRWSYNETMAELLAVYFRMVKSREEVSLTGLMDLLIRRWITREPVSDLPLSDLDAKLYLVILDSLSMRLEGIPAEETILLLDDEDLLSKLSDCESWADVNDAMARLRKERTP